eukprot:gene3537-4040_t
MAYGGWTLIARFSNADSINWIKSDGSYWYDTVSAGATTSPSTNADMVNKAFHSAHGFEFKITRTDNPYHDHLLYTTSSCLAGMDFRTFITRFGNFRNAASWGVTNACRTQCTIVSYSSAYSTTSGFAQHSCSSDLQSSNQVGFWCHYSSGDGSVIMIGGGGSACSRADHGLAVTEENYSKLGYGPGGLDFGDSPSSGATAYALNLWVR